MDPKPKKRVPRKAVFKVVPKKTLSKPSIKTTLVKGAVEKSLPKKKPVAKKSLEAKVSATSSKKIIKNEELETVSFTTGNISLRLREKANIYSQWYQQNSPIVARPIAQVFGYIFIVLGFLSIFFLTTPAASLSSQFLASVICSGDKCQVDNATDGEMQTALKPVVKFLNTPQVEQDRDTELIVSILHVKEHSLLYISRQTQQRTVLLPSSQNTDGNFVYLLPTKTLPSGDYKVLVRVVAEDGITKSELPGPYFKVLAPEIILTNDTVQEAEDSKASTTTTESTNVSISKTDSSVSSSEDKTEADAQTSIKETIEVSMPVPDIIEDEMEIGEVVTNIDNPELLPADETKLATTSNLAIEPNRESNIELVPSILKNSYKIIIKPTYRYASIEIYARADNSRQTLFLGIASRTDTGFVYWLDGTSLPAGRYQIIARAIDNSQLKETFTVNFENSYIKPTYTQTPEYQDTKEVIRTQIAEIANSTSSQIAVLLNPQEPLLPKILETTTATSSPTTTPEMQQAKEILMEFKPEFNDLFRRYASAIQSGDENNLRLSEAELADKIDYILTERKLSIRDEGSIYNLEVDLQNKISEVKEQVKKVESLKVERTKEASKVDTDKDGLTDYDEYLLYVTNPSSPDTDGDGVNDGVEISLGYDPLSAKPEAIISFASPKEVNHIDDTLLRVKSVSPLLVYEEENSKPLVQSEISGYGLPNSFVTLYIFSDPIVVTVKTKDDGSFSYTFSKELEDGEHEVYVALTDNQGDIVVRSEPFRFVKQAEAFTYVESPEVAPITSMSDATTPVEKTYNLVAAMGVVAFGLILLLLGQSLRQEKVKIVTS